MKAKLRAIVAIAAPMPLVPIGIASACDDLIETIMTDHLAPVMANMSCPAPLEKSGHKLAGVCYESSGPRRISGSI